MQCILDRIFVQLEDLKREHDLGNGVKLEIARPVTQETREKAKVTVGTVVAVGPDAYSRYGYKDDKPVKVGDVVQFAQFAGRILDDPDNPDSRVVVLLDEDVLAINKSKETH